MCGIPEALTSIGRAREAHLNYSFPSDSFSLLDSDFFCFSTLAMVGLSPSAASWLEIPFHYKKSKIKFSY
jgi:hypothetical protein